MIIDIISSSAPGILVAMGALISEFSGAMALFLEGIINLGGFLCFVFSDYFHSLIIGTTLSVFCCTIFITLIAYFIEKTHANVFLTGAAVNLFSAGCISILSSIWYSTNGVIAFQTAVFSIPHIRYETTAGAWLIIFILIYILQRTSWGLSLRVTGTDGDVLYVNGISTSARRIQAWTISGACAAAAGCILVLRLQSFVPNISSGRGWIALAIVFLGRKNTYGVVFAAVVFTVAEYIAAFFVPSATLLSIPYITALILFLLIPSSLKDIK